MAYIENGGADKQFLCSDKKKNIFLIGDSIRLGYCQTVQELLADQAAVFFLEDNCRNSQYILTSLYTWANMFDDPARVDVVQFNCGHWDAARWYDGEFSLTSEAEYGKNIRLIVAMVQKLFPAAKIIFVTTTAIAPHGVMGLNPRTNADICRYNQIGVAAAQENGVIVNDLFAVTKDWDDACYIDFCHFTEEANRLLGEAVAKTLRAHF